MLVFVVLHWMNGGWYNARYTKEDATKYMLDMVRRYVNNPWVIGLDVRNEIRPMFSLANFVGQLIPNPLTTWIPQWGRGGDRDWAAAAEEMGNAALEVDPKLLIIIQGFYQVQWDEVLFFIRDQKGNCRRPRVPQVLKKEMIDRRPINLNVPNRLVYSCHTYEFFYNFEQRNISYEEFTKRTDDYWGDVANMDIPFFLGEFGIESNPSGMNTDFWKYLIRYIKERKFHWAYWSFEGTYAGPNTNNCGVNPDANVGGGNRRSLNNYGLLSKNYKRIRYPPQLTDLQSIMFGNESLALNKSIDL